MKSERSRLRWLGWIGAVGLAAILIAGALVLAHPLWSDLLFNLTGEETLVAQVRGGLEWLGNGVRPSPDTADDVPVDYAGANPFGINVFLEQEVEPRKREQAVQMIADSGFHWLRQEFPWEDIEIHGKGDFEDRRHEPARSAWEKYDHIVALAEQYDLEIIARLSNPPSWSRAGGDEVGALAPPDDLADYGDFVQTVVERYRGRIRVYQIWNEPNIYPEWGDRQVSPEAYTELLKEGYTRVKTACPECIVLSGALAQTIPLGPRDLNDFIFLQRMYDAGAGAYFDVLSMQGYGLWSGPTDRRMRPRVLNFSRPMYLRDIMVKNGDSHKPIWITEMNWNAPPADLPDRPFGFVTLEQQARYAVLAYQRAQQEWPWVGVVNFWFFKRASDAERQQPMYYFRMVDADFTPLPVYEALSEYIHSAQAQMLYPGVYQEDHWLLSYEGSWQMYEAPDAQFGQVRRAGDSASTVTVPFVGTGLWLTVGPEAEGTFAFGLDAEPEQQVAVSSGELVALVRGLSRGPHTVRLRPVSGSLSVDSIIVEERSRWGPWLIAGGVLVFLIVVMLWLIAFVRRRRRWYDRSRAPG